MIQTEPTDEQIQQVFNGLMSYGIAEVQVQSLLDRAKEPRRMVLSALPQSHEIAIGLEGSGFIILASNDRVNEFRLIEAGFQIGAARIAVALFHGVAVVSRIANLASSRDVPQLEDKRS